MLTLTQVNIEVRLLIEANRKHGRQIERSNKCSAALPKLKFKRCFAGLGRRRSVAWQGRHSPTLHWP
jgi:hypothetical protein